MEVLYDEGQRLSVLNSYAILDTAPEEDFDELTRLAALLCDTPVSLISFTDQSRIWFKSQQGITLDALARDGAFCSYAIEHPDEPLIIPDARLDPRFAHNALVTGAPYIVFYAGVALLSPEGYSIGTFSVVDLKPRTLTEVQLQALETLSRQASKLLDLRKKTRELEREKGVFEEQSALFRKTSRVARIDLWEIDLVNNRVYLGDVIKQIHEAPTLDDVLTIDQLGEYYLEGPDRNTMFAVMGRAIRYGVPFDVEVRVSTFTGRVVWVRVTGEAEMAHGRCLRLYGTFQDVDEQVQTRQQLEESQAELRQEANFYKSIIDNQAFYIIKTDLDGNYTFMNEFFCETFGVDRAAWLGKPSLSGIITEDHSACMETAHQALATPNVSHRVLLRKFSAHGLMTNNWDFKALTDADGHLTEIVCIGYDVSSLMEKQQQLQTLADVTAEQNKRLINFTHIISHNIRSHAANLSGVLDIIDPQQPDTVQTYLPYVHRVADNLTETIQNLNEIISIQSNVNLPKTAVNLRVALGKTLAVLEPSLQEANAEVNVAVPDTATLYTNVAYLDSILLNLLTNALKYRSPDRQLRIEITLRHQPGYKVLTVQDNGLGIDVARHRSKLFGMYKTFHNNPDAKGLGLFLVKSQIEAMGGRIAVESTVDQGATFNVFFHENH